MITTLNPLTADPFFPSQPTPGAVAPAAESELPQDWLNWLASALSGSQSLGSAWAGFGGAPDGQVRVAVIDDWTPEENGFNHGANIDGIIRAGGQGIETIQFDLNDPAGRNVGIENALDQIASRAAQGEQFDAVNISQQDFVRTGQTEQLAQTIEALQDVFGIPVVVAAGNGGANANNLLAETAAFRVENSDFGSEQRAATSGTGNIRSEGEFTSQATANVTSRVAQLRESGLSIEGIRTQLAATARQEGGSLDRGPAAPPAAQPGGAPEGWGGYTVRKGDTLSKLAQRYGGISLEEFQKYNPEVKDVNKIFVGQEITLPPAALERLQNEASSPAPTPRGRPALAAAPPAKGPALTDLAVGPVPNPTPKPTRAPRGVI
ncbi:MAG: LysM peptidoglycan-binding domain-containing protein [Vulcanimicrobiota bacterium]